MGQNASRDNHDQTEIISSPKPKKNFDIRSPVSTARNVIRSPFSPRSANKNKTPRKTMDESVETTPRKALDFDDIRTPAHNNWLHLATPSSSARSPSRVRTFRFSDFKIHEKCLGQGAFARVMLGTHIPSRRQVAVKIIDKEKIPESMRDYVVNEPVVLAELSQKNILKLLLADEDEHHIYLFLEFMAGGDLHSRVESKTTLSEKETKAIFAQILLAVDHTHKKGYCHRDIKLENILVQGGEGFDDPLRVLLIDFGFASKMVSGPDHIFTDFPGSVCYAAPELICGKPYTGPQADIYSLGVVIYTMLYGRCPFYSEDKRALFRMLTQEAPQFDENVSSELADLAGMMMAKQPQMRPTIEQIWNHPWMRDAPNNPTQTVQARVVSALKNGSAITIETVKKHEDTLSPLISPLKTHATKLRDAIERNASGDSRRRLSSSN
eukprot:TRINITY_DN785_c0_g1_i6.p1 TRINITY_DN785_c0_g1~~TRINITY_DN785_c0_g1_i6.p1  ORF type:complete len:438 (+),score=246.33 TRINITY_DN785_c0_g1_i6:81-1394(+)